MPLLLVAMPLAPSSTCQGPLVASFVTSSDALVTSSFLLLM